MMLTDEQIESISREIERSDFFDVVVPFARAVERALQPQWSDQPPTEAGWYWYRTQSTDEPHIIEGSRDGERMEWYLGDALMYAELRGQWAGPLTPPGG